MPPRRQAPKTIDEAARAAATAAQSAATQEGEATVVLPGGQIIGVPLEGVAHQVEEPGDEFDELFDQYDQGGVRVILSRQAPEFLWENGEKVNIKGYLEDLVPPIENVEAYIKARHEGGKYQLVRWVNAGNGSGRLRKSIMIEIAGKPKLPEQEHMPVARPATRDVSLPEGESYQGQSIAGTNEQFFARLERMMATMMAVKTLETRFAPPAPAAAADINGTLLAYLLKDKERRDDPVGDLSKILEMQKTLLETLPEKNASPDLMTMLNTAMGMVGKIIEAKRPTPAVTRMPARPLAGPTTVQPSPILLPGSDAAASGTTVVGEPSLLEPETGEEEAMPGKPDVKAMAATAIAHIVQIYTTDQDTAPSDVVAVLDNTIPSDQATRVAIAPWRTMLWTAAKGQMAEYFGEYEAPDRAAQVEHFKSFFDAVFDQFTDAARVPKLLGGES